MSIFSKLFGKKTATTNSVKPFIPNPSGKIVAAKVLRLEKHPNADRLQIVYVDAGHGEVGPIVCGAFNFKVGDMVVLALPGATIAQNIHSDGHESFTLEKAKIRGVESQGMICAAFELGQSKETDDGIMLLPNDVKAGAVLA